MRDEHSSSRDAVRMAAFTSPEADDRTNFERRWAKAEERRVYDEQGHRDRRSSCESRIASFDLEGHRESPIGSAREDWGRGIATRALQSSCSWRQPVACARAAGSSAASIRVLTKCGFLILIWEKSLGFAHGRNEETDEVVLRLDA